jgi:hypothetical protein
MIRPARAGRFVSIRGERLVLAELRRFDPALIEASGVDARCVHGRPLEVSLMVVVTPSRWLPNPERRFSTTFK